MTCKEECSSQLATAGESAQFVPVSGWPILLTAFSFRFDDFALSFLSVLFEGIPFLLLGSLISGAVDVFVPPGKFARWMPANSATAIFLSGLMGLVFPICECGSVVVIRRFLRKGLPVSCAVTYMLAAPIVSPVVILSTYAAFSGQDPGLMTALRLGMGYAIAVLAGFIMRSVRVENVLQPAALQAATDVRRAGLQIAPSPELGEVVSVGTESLSKKILSSLRIASADFLDVTFYLVIGVALTSVFNTAVRQEIIDPLAASPLPATMVLMGLAALLALCSTSDAFVAASFVKFPAVAKLGFLVFGPMFDLKLFFLYGVIFQRRWVVVLGLGLFAIIALVCSRLTLIMP